MPVINYQCSKCGHSFQLVRPQAKADQVQPCPKCGHDAFSSSSFQGAAPPGPSTLAPETRGGRELPPWVRGQVEAQVRQLVSGSDAMAGHQVELVTQEVMRELGGWDVARITPGNIKMLAEKHLTGLDSWARTARRRNAQLDAADKLDDED